MLKRITMFTLAFVAMGLLVLAPLACQQAEQPAAEGETTAGDSQAKPTGRLMAAKPKAEAVAETVEEGLEEGAEVVEEGLEEGAAAVEEGLEEGAEAVEEIVEEHTP